MTDYYKLDVGSLRSKARKIFRSALKSVDAFQLVSWRPIKKSHYLICEHNKMFDLKDFERIFIIGFGKYR